MLNYFVYTIRLLVHRIQLTLDMFSVIISHDLLKCEMGLYIQTVAFEYTNGNY